MSEMCRDVNHGDNAAADVSAIGHDTDDADHGAGALMTTETTSKLTTSMRMSA